MGSSGRIIMSSTNEASASAACVGPQSEMAGKAEGCEGCPNQANCASGKAKEEDPAIAEIAARLRDVKHVVLVLSGKGGVGKSTVASQLAFSLAAMDRQVGLVDVDICGPSVPTMMGVRSEEVHSSNMGWSPVFVDDNLCVMSIGFMVPDDSAVIWRGPKKDGFIKNLFKDTDWGALDYLIVDAPPGTSDEHITTIQLLKRCNVAGALIVTTPQEVALADVRKEINFCSKTKTRVLGVVENMYDVFPPTSGGAEKMASDMDVTLLGRLPMDRTPTQLAEEGKSYVETHPQASGCQMFQQIVRKMVSAVEGTEVDTPASSAPPASVDVAALKRRRTELQDE